MCVCDEGIYKKMKQEIQIFEGQTYGKQSTSTQSMASAGIRTGITSGREYKLSEHTNES